ncbi:hypothetical protein Tco_1442185, partial [Tanacetum coccineum]
IRIATVDKAMWGVGFGGMWGGQWNGYLRKGRKTKPKRQNRTRNGKAWKRQSQDKA